MTAAAIHSEKRPLKDDLRDLMRSPRELWLVLLTKFLEYVGVFSLLYVLTLWLSKDLGMDDVAAGWWAGLFSMITSVIAFFVGFVADSIGFRPALIGAFAVSAVARALMSFSHGRLVALIGLMLLAFGVATGTPSMNAALKRYSNARTRSFAFSLYYLSFNIGGAAAGFLVDISRNAFSDPVTHAQLTKVVRFPLYGERAMTAYGMVYAVGFGCSVAAFLVALLLRKDIDLDAAELAATHARGERDAEAEARAMLPKEKREAPWTIFASLIKEKPFWRFMLFVALLSLVKLIFQHYHFTWPKYVLREMGETFPLGKFQAINPLLIIVMVPLATTLTRHRSAFHCIVVGSFISTISMFILCLPASYPVILASILFLSIGEALWSPRVYEYTATIAPRGREASYMGLSALPFFFAKMIAGPMSGYLLAAYVPEKGPRHPMTMWLIIGLMTLAGPVAIWLLRGVIEGRPETRPDLDDKPAEAPVVA